MPDDRTLEEQRDQEMTSAFALLYGTGRYEDDYGAAMSAASAHATLALVFQGMIEKRDADAGG